MGRVNVFDKQFTIYSTGTLGHSTAKSTLYVSVTKPTSSFGGTDALKEEDGSIGGEELEMKQRLGIEEQEELHESEATDTKTAI